MKPRVDKVAECGECPFARGLGGGDVMPCHVTCELAKESIPTPREGIAGRWGAPPPSFCPLRKEAQMVVVKLDVVALRGERFERSMREARVRSHRRRR